MSLELYDESLMLKLKYWTEKTDIQVYNVEDSRRLFQVIADKSGDKAAKLPIIALRRVNGFSIKNSNKQPLSFDGLRTEQTEECGSHLNAIPISINYKLDVYTRYQKENDLYVRNLIFNLINYPTLLIHFTYNGSTIEQYGNIILGDSVEMDSPSIKMFPDQICRQTISFKVDDAYLWDVRVRLNTLLNTGNLSVAIKDNDGFIIEQLN